MVKYNAYVICTSPRSGSKLLCGMLASTGIAGKPASYFYETTLEGWLDDLAVERDVGAPERNILEAAFRAAAVRGRNGGDTFGLRMQWHSLAFFLEKLAVLHPEATTDADRFHQAFGTTLFVHLTRSDKLDQAVSFLKAQQTGLWHLSSDGSELERTAPHREPVYDRSKIEACVDMMTAYDRDWNNWFEGQGIAPVRLSYDDLAADPLGILRRVLDSVGLDPSAANNVTPTVKKLSDRINGDWTAQYRRELGLPV